MSMETCDAPVLADLYEAASLYRTKITNPIDEISAYEAIAYTINLVNHFLVISSTLGISWKCFELKLEKTATHAFLCTLGFMCLSVEGLMVRNPYNFFTYSWDARRQTIAHLSLQVVGGLLGVVGTVQKVIGKRKHFHTLHGKFGLAACIFCLINLIFGGFALYSEHFSVYVSPTFNKFVHNFLGIATFVTVIVAQYYGHETGFFRRNFTQIPRWKTVTVLIFVLTFCYPFGTLLWKYLRLTRNFQ